jgi:XRE family aerobic/anaerobic benzoate catabolism transcriptional regulator
VAEIGAVVRRRRARRGLTRQRLASDSGLSVRYLAQIESGKGNPSAGVLKAIADALDIAVADLLPGAQRSPMLARIHALLGQLQAQELPGIAQTLEQHIAEKPSRARRIALVGVRGAGKSTLGPLLAKTLGCPFAELDHLIEQAYGASVPMLFEIAGAAAFRRHERACLEAVIAQHDRVVIAAAGGIVSGELRAAAARHPRDLDQGEPAGAHEPRDGAGRFPPDG